MRCAISSGCSTKFDLDSITPGMRTLPSGSLTVSNTFHSCAWRGFAASSAMARGPRAEDDVDHVGQRDVAVVRPFVVSPAQVHAQPVRRNVAQRVVERLDVQLRLLAKLRDAQAGVLDVPSHAEVGTVDLQDDARGGDRFIFVAHRLRNGGQVCLVARVMVVAKEQRHHARRRCGEKSLLRRDAGQRSLEVRNVGARGLRVAHADRRVARRRLAPRASGIAEHALRELRKVGEVLVDERVAGPAEAAQPVLDVGRVARLAHLAVVDHIDAGLRLLAHHLDEPPTRRDWRAPRARPEHLPRGRTSSVPGRPAAAGCRYAS